MRGRRVRADLVDGLQLVLARRRQGVERAEVADQRLRRLLADVADPEREEQARRVVALALLDLGDQVRRRLLAPALELDEVRRLQVVDRGHVRQQSRRHELVDELLAEPLDVHRAPAAEVPQGLAHDGRAGRVDAARRDLALLADDRVAADRAVRRHPERRRALRPLLEDHAHDLRDDVAALLDDDGVADAHVLAREVLVVVERRPLDRRARRAGPARSARPASAFPVRPTLTPISRTTVVASSAGYLYASAQRGDFAVAPSASCVRAVVHLDHDAVGLELELVPLLVPLLDERAHLLEGLAAAPVRVDRETQRLQPRERRRLARRQRRRLDDGVEPGVEPAPGRDRASRAGASSRPRRCAGWRRAAPLRPRAPR